ncbi:MAG: TIM barrel protein [Rhodospirillales bacterium]|nr:TIM barrel protein [Rhodospirillales bacterium]
MIRFSANLGFLWQELPLLARIAAAATAGFEAVELHWPYDIPASDIRATCAQNGVQLLALNSPLGDIAKGEFGLGALPGREKDFEASIDAAVTYCAAAGGTAVHVMAGLVDPVAVPAATDTFARNLEFAADRAGAVGLGILLEPLNQRDKPGYFYSTLAPAAALIERVGRKNVRLMLDVYHVGVSEGDITRKIERHLAIVGHVQLAAVPSRAEPDEGEIDYRDILRTLDRLGYTGWIGAEYRPRTTTDAGLAWRERLVGKGAGQ